MNFSEPTRAWLYRISTAVIPLLAVYGILEESAVAGWIALAAAVFNTGMASVNTTTKQLPPPDPARDQGYGTYDVLILVVVVVAVVLVLTRVF